MIRPFTNQVLLRILPPPTHSDGGIEFTQRHISPEERVELNRDPQPPPPDMAIVEAIGPWPKLKCGLTLPPPFPPGAKVIVREGSGAKLNRDVGERLKLVRTEDILAVVS